MEFDELVKLLDHPEAPQAAFPPHPTGLYGLDAALRGGFPGGRITELYGDPGTGKTTVAMRAAAIAQRSGTVVWLDSGHFDPGAARAAGIDLDSLVLIPPCNVVSGLVGLRMSLELASMVVVDSVPGLDLTGTTTCDLAAEFGALQRDMRDHGPAGLFISNGTVSEGTTGALSTIVRMVSSVRVRFVHERIDLTALITKHPMYFPVNYTTTFRIRNGAIDSAYELLLLGLHTGVLEQHGNWVYYMSMKLGQGLDNAADALREGVLTAHIRRVVLSCLT